MSTIEHLFATKLYTAQLRGPGTRSLNDQLRRAIDVLAAEDAAGQAWSERNGYLGYTSYSSLTDLTWRMPEFAALEGRLDAHVQAFATDLEFDLGGDSLGLDSIWVNVLEPGGFHGGHIHPHAIISGTYYVDVPAGARAIRFEDPRLAMMMAAPVRQANARRENKPFITIEPKPGMVVLWESWLRHDVPLNHSDKDRISISFNYAAGQHDGRSPCR